MAGVDQDPGPGRVASELKPARMARRPVLSRGLYTNPQVVILRTDATGKSIFDNAAMPICFEQSKRSR